MLGSTIQRELAGMILRDLNDPRLPATALPSITRVKVSTDLSVADVYVTVMGTPGQQSAALMALKHSAGMMRTKLTKALTLRVAPYIKFHLDEQLRKELDLLNVLQKVHEENEELDRQRGAAAAADGDGDADGDAARAADEGITGGREDEK
jgi:ribosome-binding factor A